MTPGLLRMQVVQQVTQTVHIHIWIIAFGGAVIPLVLVTGHFYLQNSSAIWNSISLERTVKTNQQEGLILARLCRDIAAALNRAASGLEEAGVAANGGGDKGAGSQDASLPDRIRQEAAQRHGVTLEQVSSPYRTKYIVRARFLTWLILYRLPLGLSLVQLGQMTGGRGHTTVINGISKAVEMLAKSPDEFGWVFEIHAKACVELGVDPRKYPLLEAKR